MPIKIIRTVNRRSERWAEIDFQPDYINVNHDCDSVVIDTNQSFQTHFGFGGAFTESAAFVLSNAGAKVRDEVAAAYFSPNGLKYNLGRMAIHSTDFGLDNYTYIQNGAFDISHEDKWVIPLIKAANKARGDKITMFATSWSPPAEFKTNNSMNHGGKLKPEKRRDWAEYIVKSILEFRKRGIEIDIVNMQNEPEAIQTWESCFITAEEEAGFLADYLFPALDKAKLDTKTIIWDHNRDRMVRRAKTSFANPKVRDRVWGVGYHWYVSDAHKNLDAVHTLYPDKHILLTECCVEFSIDKGSDRYARGERYGRQIINDFNNFGEGWIDWNLALDEQGGPNHAENYCEAPVMIEGGKAIYNPSYYYIGHFSRYIEPGAKRVKCINDAENQLYTTAYRNPNGKLIIVVQNEGYVRETEIIIDGKGFNISLPDRSINTLIVD